MSLLVLFLDDFDLYHVVAVVVVTVYACLQRWPNIGAEGSGQQAAGTERRVQVQLLLLLLLLTVLLCLSYSSPSLPADHEQQRPQPIRYF